MSFRSLLLDTFASRTPHAGLAECWQRAPRSPTAFRRLLAVEECAADLLVRLREMDILAELPRAHAEQLESRAVRQTSRMLALRADLREVLAALRARGVVVTLLKGAAFDRVGLRSLRVCNDLDLMVAPSDEPATLDALKALGYRVPAGEHLPPGFHHLPPMLRERSAPVELHTRALFRENGKSGDPPATVECGDGLRIMAPTEWAWHVLAHDAYHHETAGHVRSALDLAALDTHYAGEIDWRDIARRCRGWPDPVAPLLASHARLRGRSRVRIPVTMRMANAALSVVREYAARVAPDDASFVFAAHKLAGALLGSPTGWVERRRAERGNRTDALPSIGRDAARLGRILLGAGRGAS